MSSPHPAAPSSSPRQRAQGVLASSTPWGQAPALKESAKDHQPPSRPGLLARPCPESVGVSDLEGCRHVCVISNVYTVEHGPAAVRHRQGEGGPGDRVMESGGLAGPSEHEQTGQSPDWLWCVPCSQHPRRDTGLQNQKGKSVGSQVSRGGSLPPGPPLTGVGDAGGGSGQVARTLSVPVDVGQPLSCVTALRTRTGASGEDEEAVAPSG